MLSEAEDNEPTAADAITPDFKDDTSSALSRFPLEWKQVHFSARRSLQDDSSPFVRRKPSNTSFVFELAHMGKPATFHEHTHGIGIGSRLSLPVCSHGGAIHHFTLVNSDIMPKELQKEFPHIRVYNAHQDDGHMTAEVTISTAGVRAQIWHNHPETGLTRELCFVDPHTAGKAHLYSVYHTSDVSDPPLRSNTLNPPCIFLFITGTGSRNKLTPLEFSDKSAPGPDSGADTRRAGQRRPGRDHARHAEHGRRAAGDGQGQRGRPRT